MKRLRTPLLALSRLRRQQQRLREIALSQQQGLRQSAERRASQALQGVDEQINLAESAIATGPSGPGLVAMHLSLDDQRQRLIAAQNHLLQADDDMQRALTTLQQSMSASAVVDRLLQDKLREERRSRLRAEQHKLDEIAIARRAVKQQDDRGEVNHG